MSTLATLPRVCHARIALLDGQLFVAVPWEAAEHLQDYLHARGVGSTLHLDPVTHTSCLQPWANHSADRVQFLVAQWQDKEEATVLGG